uniref:Uncharacterized protein n=1 Tax=Elaeophora elaphi TaxID=1147741 RepID=A0A0R3S3Z9_9BILA
MYIVTIVLAVELIRCILKLLYERKKYQISKKEIPVLLADKDSLGENTVYKETISTSLPKTAKNDDNFAKQLEQKSSGTLFGHAQNGASTSFGRMLSNLNGVDATQSTLDKNISQKPRLEMTERSRKKLITAKSIEISNTGGAHIEKNLKLNISMPSERTQVENISEEKCKT